MSSEVKDIIKVLLFLIIILGGLILLGSCDSSWPISGYEI